MPLLFPNFGGSLGGGGGGTPTDPNFSDVELLLHGDGSDGATGTSAIVDSSSNSRTPSLVQTGCELDTAQKKFGSASILFDGAARIDYSHAAAFQLGSGDFTLETWVRFASISDQAFISRWDAGNTLREFIFDYRTSAAGLRFVYSTDGSGAVVVSGSWSPSAATWYHVAVSRAGNNLRLFVDGNQVGSTHDMTGVTIFSGSQPLQLACYEDSNSLLNGWIDDLRYTVGTGRYTSNFTPPSEAFPNS